MSKERMDVVREGNATSFSPRPFEVGKCQGVLEELMGEAIPR